MSILKTIALRVYHDYLEPLRVKEYEEILKTAVEKGYAFETIASFDELIKNGSLYEKKRLIIRRDVDTKAFTVMKKMHEAEQKYGAVSTSFFRKKTVMPELMEIIRTSGGIASYHYEEIAVYAEQHGIRTREDAVSKLSEIRPVFERNLAEFREITAQPCMIVASHGDFINVRLGIENYHLLRDQQLRRRCGIEREAYDEEQMNYVTCRIADHSSRDFVKEVLEAMQKDEAVLYILTHPRQWGAAPIANTKENLSRLLRGIRYSKG